MCGPFVKPKEGTNLKMQLIWLFDNYMMEDGRFFLKIDFLGAVGIQPGLLDFSL